MRTLDLKPSRAPPLWLLFGAGGMLAALAGPMLVFITGIAVPLGWPLPSDLLAYPRALAFARSWLGGAFLLAAIALFAWHAAHRIFHVLHDLGLPTGRLAVLACYGSAAVATIVALVALAIV